MTEGNETRTTPLPPFDPASYRGKRRRAFWIGWALVVAGLLVLIDAPSSYPIPLRGPAAFFTGLLVSGVGYGFLRWLKSLPIREAILVGRRHENTLTPSMLVQELDLDPQLARRTVKAIEDEGLGVSELEKQVAEQVAKDAGLSSVSALPGLDDRVLLRE